MTKLFIPGVGEQQVREQGTNPAPWSPEEQKLLEQALKSYPASTADRWDRISECISTRSKKDCMKRYKVSSVDIPYVNPFPLILIKLDW